MIRIGVIGCGHWGQNYVRNFNELPHSIVVQCCDLKEVVLERVQRRFPQASVTKNYAEILNNSHVRAVTIATPATTHYQIAKECLGHDKHVLVEKPLSLDPGEGKELIKLAKERKKILMVGHTFLYNPAVRKIKEYMENGDLGKIYYLHATRTHLGLIREDVNAIWDLAPHDVSIFSYLLGTLPHSVIATGGKFLGNSRDDVGFITLNYPNNVVGNIFVSWVDSNKVREIAVVGSKARVVFNDIGNLERVKICQKGVASTKTYDDFGEFQLVLRDGDIVSPKIELHEPLKTLCQHFLDCIENGRTPITDGRNGLAVVKVMNAIDISLQKGGTSVAVESMEKRATKTQIRVLRL